MANNFFNETRKTFLSCLHGGNLFYFGKIPFFLRVYDQNTFWKIVEHYAKARNLILRLFLNLSIHTRIELVGLVQTCPDRGWVGVWFWNQVQNFSSRYAHWEWELIMTWLLFHHRQDSFRNVDSATLQNKLPIIENPTKEFWKFECLLSTWKKPLKIFETVWKTHPT